VSGLRKAVVYHGLTSCLVGLLTALVPSWAHGQVQSSQVFSDVIREVFASGGGVSCGDFNLNPNPAGTLVNRCNVAGTNLAGGSGGSTTALTNESSPAKERLVEKAVGAWNLYVSADYEHFQKQETEFEPGYKNYIWRGAMGADYLIRSVTLGGAFRYIHDNGNFGGSGDFNPDFETNSYGAVFYVNTAPTENSYLSGSVQYLRQNFSIGRAVFFDVNGTGVRSFIGAVHGHPNGNEYEMQLAGGYDFHFDSVSIGPSIALNYLYDRIDDYSESGSTGLELRYSNQHQQSLATKLGGHGSIAISAPFGVILPQVFGEYVHEFLDPQRKTDFSFVEDRNQVRFTFENDKPDRDYFNVGAGVVLQLAHGIAPFVSFRTLLGYNHETSRQVTAGARFEF
jgi:outer membrane autotransporter protein